uniref:Uncharacterized protein n=1 Tax=Glossina austeni TaxID=7395 RepID=A0A1A9UU86_GLOAU
MTTDMHVHIFSRPSISLSDNENSFDPSAILSTIFHKRESNSRVWGLYLASTAPNQYQISLLYLFWMAAQIALKVCYNAFLPEDMQLFYTNTKALSPSPTTATLHNEDDREREKGTTMPFSLDMVMMRIQDSFQTVELFHLHIVERETVYSRKFSTF